jgi:cell division protein FtsL
MIGPLLEVHTRPQPAAAGQPEARTIVESGDGRRRLSAGLIGLVILGVTLGATAHVAVHAKRMEVAIALGKEERAFRELTEQRRNLEIEVGMLKDPARIITIARDKLGMHPPAPEDIHPLVRTPDRSAAKSAERSGR